MAASDQLVSVELPVGPRWVQIALAIVFLIWGGSHFVAPHSGQIFADRLEDELFAVPLLLMGLLYVWMSASKLTLGVSAKELRVTTAGLGVRWVAKYPLSEISNLRFEYRTFGRRPSLAFDRRGKRRFANVLELDVAANNEQLEPIYAQFPTLAPAVRSQRR